MDRQVPSGPRWIHEIKFDGYRIQVHIKNGKVRVFTSRVNDWSTRYFIRSGSDPNLNADGHAILAPVIAV
jgi:bifunctional non-homologous end joining protein LigD